jgi:uncharacterized protein involved in exopolysaccharide biosynthesis
MIPTGQIPAIGTDYIRLMREFKYMETMYEMLAKQYEAARLEEANESAIVQVICKAQPPEKKDRPKVIILFILATAGGFFLSILSAFVAEYARSAADSPENEIRVKLLKENIWKI